MLNKKQIAIIKKSNSFNDLTKSNPEIIYLIRKHKISPHYEELQKTRFPSSEWTNELIQRCADTCLHREEFCDLWRKASMLAKEKGIFQQVMLKKPYGGQNYTKYNYDVIIQLCKENNIQSFYEFRTKFPGPYQQAFQKKIVDEIKSYFKKILKDKYKDDKKLVDLLKPNYPELLKLPDNELREYFTYFPNKRIKIFNTIKKEVLKERIN